MSCQNQNTTDDSDSFESSAFSADSTVSKWRVSKFPISLKHGSSFSLDEKLAIENSAKSWSESVDNKLEFFNVTDSNIDEKSKSSDYDDGEFGIYKITKWPSDLPHSALAVTQIFGNKKSSGNIEIEHADILVNFDNFTFKTDDSWGYDFESIVLHEMGHFLGLFHTGDSSNESIMYPSISRYTTNQYPKELDTDNISKLYNISQTASAADVKTTLQRTSQDNKEKGQKVKIVIELYPNGAETIKIQTGETHEKLHANCHHIKF